jgi:hypothetical protein
MHFYYFHQCVGSALVAVWTRIWIHDITAMRIWIRTRVLAMRIYLDPDPNQTMPSQQKFNFRFLLLCVHILSLFICKEK